MKFQWYVLSLHQYIHAIVYTYDKIIIMIQRICISFACKQTMNT